MQNPTLEVLASGHGLLEGPRYDDRDGSLYYSDASEGGVYRIASDGTVTTAVPRRKAVGGIALHARGGIVISGRDISHVHQGQSRTLFKCAAPSINDILVDAAGRLLVGTVNGEHLSRNNRVPSECLLLAPDGTATELYGGLFLPNGIAFSPNGDVLYHADTGQGCVVVHDWDAVDGRASGRRRLPVDDDIVPDGLAIDEDGTVWIADLGGSGAVRGFTPEGREVGRIAVPATRPTSLSFGGSDRRDLFIVTADNTAEPARRGTVFRTRVATPGLAVPLTTV